MKNSITGLYPSLVGGHTEFKAKGAVVTDTVTATRAKIEKDINLAKGVNSKLSVYLLAEIFAFYRNESYYHAVRGLLLFGRYTKDVEEWLENPITTRRDFYKELTTKKVNRDLLIKTIGYLLKNVPKYKEEFKPLLTREEIFYVI
jgi:hypothetical protein